MIPSFQGKRVAVVGIGNELKGDDAAGVLVARALKKDISNRTVVECAPVVSTSEKKSQAVPLVIDAGPSPENFSGPLRRFHPDLVILVDAADMARSPGEFAWVDWQDVDGFSGSTHFLPPTVFARFLMQDLGCQVAFIGIQPADLTFGREPSTPVLLAVSEIRRQLAELLLV